MSNEEKELRTRAWLPALSGQAFVAARERALASGQSVLESTEGIIYEVFPSGVAQEVKRIAPPLLVEKRTIILLK